MKNIILLGGSGSIGKKTVDIVDQHADLFNIVGIAVGNNIAFLEEYLLTHNPLYCCVKNESDLQYFKEKYPNTTFFYGDEGLISLTSVDNIDLVFNAILGFVGLLPTLNALKHHVDVAIANKETLVSAGCIVKKVAKESKAKIIPVDSEHSAIFQCLQGYKHSDIKRLIITASGGSFRNLTREQLVNVTKEDALKHPRWSMGAKITIDSATMMNKGFEVIEAHELFDIPYENIKVVLHPESIVHSLVEFKDHSLLAQLAVTDMRLPIQYALTYPKRISNNCDTLELEDILTLNFQTMDYNRFPLLKLAYDTAKKGGNMTAILNGANERSVNLFLQDKIKFLDIEKLNFKVMELAGEMYCSDPDLDKIIESHYWAMNKVDQLVKEL